jgi:folate-dependent phosphoribosylglycinamide formyltransferase PurN
LNLEKGSPEFAKRLFPPRRSQWAVLISGRGSNLAALLDLQDEIDVRLVLSSNSKAYGLKRAERAGVPCGMVPTTSTVHESGRLRKIIHWPALSRLLKEKGITHIFLAGFMKVVPAVFIEEWAGRILNLHPSLLPAYPGLHSIERAIADRADLGVSIHEVVEDVDAGPMLCQRVVMRGEKIGVAIDKNILDSATIEFLVHVCEQKVVKEAALRWRRK